jgi:hypothetical protein
MEHLKNLVKKLLFIFSCIDLFSYIDLYLIINNLYNNIIIKVIKNEYF